MTFLPIVSRELRVTARRPSTYWSRMVVATLMLVLASWVFLMTYRSGSASQAVVLFGTLAGGMVFVGGISGMGAVADSLSSEKREGTLGLLFLTPLRGYDVVLGKLFAGSLTVLYGMLGVTPILALPLLMGGVSPSEFARMALLMVNTMLWSLAIGVWVSSISRDEKRARAGALLLVALFAAGFPLAGAFLQEEFRLRGVAQWFLLFSPGYTFASAWDKSRVNPWAGYWASVLTAHLMAWVFLGLACWFTPRTWQDRPVRKPGRLWEMFRGVAGSRDESGHRFRTVLLSRNAFFWLTSRPRFKPVFVWAILLALTLVWLGFGVKYPDAMFDPAMYVFVGLVWNAVLKVWVTSEATRQIAQDRRSSSIELMLTTALSIREIAFGLWLALKRQFLAPLLVVLGAELLLMMIGADKVGRGQDRVIWIAVWMCGMVVFLADLLAIYAVGLWQSAIAKGPAEAAGATALRILALPWILFMGLGAAVALADGTGIIVGVPDPEWVFWLGGWTMLAIGVDLFFGVRSWHAVHTRFREVVVLRGGRGWGHALGRIFGLVRAQRTVNR